LRKIGWSRQKPVERASQRDEEEIARWHEETWPELEKKPSASSAGSFS
jgi:transposase